MATFIMLGKYSADAVKQISLDRIPKANQIVQQCGGSIVSTYATMGETDILVITEFPGIGEAMKASVDLNKAIGISFVTLPALPIEDFDKLVGG
ncbi:GYD domain-containing protein [Methylobacter sp. YRD-M1]|uniref:GYD domain-containing protein n=1 Tax=Methylobacter sp. YRD-M1 TaxID=2911520 RepID=UPI00227B4EFF|nr:GYD domain-containing protein [Methylobacter sp. YRD-M1]WAK03808.1 GYD domain-containing protein [Methylobacter sp. YRD-M1]